MIVQVSKICTPNETVCSTKMRKDSFGCLVSCTGLYADVSYSKGNPEETTMDEEDMILDTEVFSQLTKDYKKLDEEDKILDTEVFSKLTKDYKTFKSKFVRNIIFNSNNPNLGADLNYVSF